MTDLPALATVGCVDLRCERRIDPIGLDATAPRLSADSRLRPVRRTWSSRRARSRWRGGGTAAECRAGASRSSTVGRHSAPVRACGGGSAVWTTAGPTDWSGWATFETGILATGEWVATMVTAEVPTPVVRFARTLEVPDDVVRARLRVTAHGIFVAAIDGTEVSDEVLAPGWTSYQHRLAVRTHDVTDLGDPARSRSPSWSGRDGSAAASDSLTQGPSTAPTVGAFAQLELQRANGSLAGDRHRRDVDRLGDALFGSRDLRRRDLRRPAPRCHGGAAGVLGRGIDPAVLCAPAAPPVRRTETVAPVAVRDNIFDFGQNLVGWLRMTVRDLPAGTEVLMRHAEILGPDGALFTEPLRTARVHGLLRRRGDRGGALRASVHLPRVPLRGDHRRRPAPPSEVAAVVVHSDLERTGWFSCSEPLLERLHENVVWGQRATSCHSRRIARNVTSASVGPVTRKCSRRRPRISMTARPSGRAGWLTLPLISCRTVRSRTWSRACPELASAVPPAGVTRQSSCPGPPTLPTATQPSSESPCHPCGRGSSTCPPAWTRSTAGVRTSSSATGSTPMRPPSSHGERRRGFDLVATVYAARSASLLARAAWVLGEEKLAAESADAAPRCSGPPGGITMGRPRRNRRRRPHSPSSSV